MSPSPDDEIQLSVVATSRNDNHGGSLTHRMQHFVDGFVAQCKRHRLRAELIMVEWNPPRDRVPLAEELRWPADSGPCDIRIVTVPPELHARFDHADKIPLFQMIAKNVGIRRARGRFVLATNIDILFSDESIRAMRGWTQSGSLFRTDRVDVPPTVPQSEDFSQVLEFCRREGFRIHANGATVVRDGPRWRALDRFKAGTDARLAYLCHLAESPFRPRRSLREVLRPPAAPGKSSGGGLPALGARLAHLTGLLFKRLLLPWPNTNACGDFTAMSRDDWFALRGYAEWHVFSWHLDSLLIHQALASGLRQRHCGSDAPVYHIEHGKGYTPEGAAELFSRLTERGIPFLTDQDLGQRDREMKEKKRSRSPIQFNGENWGLADAALPESWPRRASAAIQLPHD